MERIHYLSLSLMFSVTELGFVAYGLARLFHEYPIVSLGTWAVVCATGAADLIAAKFERLAAQHG